MDFSQIRKIYFLGIGGIGMSAIARYFNDHGVEIHGYDLVHTSLTKKLEAEGMSIHYNIDSKKIPRDIDLVVMTPAIPKDHDELVWLNANKYTVMKRAEVLGLLSRHQNTVAVAGTHGKTTTSSLITHVLKYCGLDISAFLGGIMVNYNSNFISGKSDIVVLEADEYDRSFLHLTPNVLIVLSMDADHLDIYGHVEEMYKAYEQLCVQIKSGGHLIIARQCLSHFNSDFMDLLKQRSVKVSFFGDDFSFGDIKIKQSRYRFNFQCLDFEKILNIKSELPGWHNISNTAVAMYVAKTFGLKPNKIKEAVEDFKGIKRRFEIVYEGNKVLLDDYAHHPEEVKHAVKTVKDLYQGKKVMGIFQPHLFSRTQDFYKGFAKELAALDMIVLLPIYRARELPIEGVKTEIIYNLIPNENKVLVKTNELINYIKKETEYDVIITIGAADLDKYHEQIIEIING